VESIDQFIKDLLQDGDKVVIDYPESFFCANKESAFIKYNTGDCVWFIYRDGKYQVSKIETNDGILA